MHVLPRVRQLHERFPDTLEVIGVHAGKFAAERKTERIAMACDRLEVHHPVVNDRQFRIWKDYAVRAWPTIAVIDPEGYLVGVLPGEFEVDLMVQVISDVIERAELRGTLKRGASSPTVSVARSAGGALRFPTRTALRDGVLWVADTGNHRVLECAWSADSAHASVVREYGGFAEPRGIAAFDGGAFVADRRGQRITRLDNGEQLHVAGTGDLARREVLEGDAAATALRSPWGLELSGDRLVVAMAGAHQLWAVDDGSLRLVAGRGGEELADGSAADALLAQPTGITRTRGGLAFADCESSAIRTLDADRIATIVGTGLFDFGDRDGKGDDVLLQHNEDVCEYEGALAVADTYNDRLKRVDPVTREATGWAGDAGVAGSLLEPAGVSSDDGILLVSDTGNHRIVVVERDGALKEVAFK